MNFNILSYVLRSFKRMICVVFNKRFVTLLSLIYFQMLTLCLVLVGLKNCVGGVLVLLVRNVLYSVFGSSSSPENFGVFSCDFVLKDRTRTEGLSS